MSSPLEELGYPLFFDVDEGAATDLDAPDVRLGQAHRARVRSLEGMQKEALVTSSVSGTTWRLASDEGEYLDGDDVAPSPLAFMTTGMVASFVTEVLALAEERGIAVEDVTLVQDNYYTMNGSALAGTMTGGALPVELEAVVEADADEETLRDLVTTAVTTSPVSGLLRGEHHSAFDLVLDGEEIPTGEVDELDGPPVEDPKDAFASLRRNAEERDPPLVRHTGRQTEPLEAGEEKYTSGESSSLQEEQDRILHLRGTCTLREDGLKHVEVEVFSPLGTMFELLADEPAGHGGRERAPDPATYVAAGIGFCFLTQMGRYADIVDGELPEYRTVQDTHLSLGAAGTGTERPGEALPVETHVFLSTPEGPEFAGELLDMSEQTCFLHALCRTDLEGPNVEVTTE